MRFNVVLAVAATVAACSAVTEQSTDTVLVGAYTAVSINGSALPVAAAPLTDGTKQDVLAEYLWISGSAGTHGVLWERVLRTTKGSTVRVDTVTSTGTFQATLNSATTSFGLVVAQGRKLTQTALDGSTHVYQRNADP